MDQSDIATALSAAGELFGVLAETAFTATPAELDKSILAADSAAGTLKTVAPATLSASLAGFRVDADAQAKPPRKPNWPWSMNWKQHLQSRSSSAKQQ